MSTSTIDWDFLKDKLQYKGRWQPLYNTEFHKFLESLKLIPKPFNPDLKKDFLKSIDSWIHSSSLNSLKGLEHFNERDVIQGVSQQIEDLCLTYGKSLYVLKGEFHYSRSISNLTREVLVADLKDGDELLLSFPFSNSGRPHIELEKILNICKKKMWEFIWTVLGLVAAVI